MEYDVRKIMTYLPHRYPFLLVDRILALTPGERILALKNVTFNEPFFQGHFPGAPVMPGVLIVEAMGQAGGVLAYESNPEENPSQYLIYLMGLDNVKFRKPVVPGDQLILELKIVKQRGKTMKMSGTAKVEDRLVAEADILATVGVKQ